MYYTQNGIQKEWLSTSDRVEGSGEYSEGLILWKRYGDDKYIVTW